MGYEQRPGTGVFFKNRNKSKENHPDYTGDIILPGGEKMTMALWVKYTKKNEAFLTGIIKSVEQEAADRPKQPIGVTYQPQSPQGGEVPSTRISNQANDIGNVNPPDVASDDLPF